MEKKKYIHNCESQNILITDTARACLIQNIFTQVGNGFQRSYAGLPGFLGVSLNRVIPFPEGHQLFSWMFM
jgi:hypothetical protein